MNLSKKLILYGVTDRRWLGKKTLEEAVEASIKGGVSAIQLREKDLDEDEFLKEAKNIKKICENRALFIINDNIDIALAADADGVHLGQSDMAAKDAKTLLGDKILGISVSTVEEAKRAQRDGADYLGVGAVFKTGTKNDAEDVSIEELKNITSAVDIPVVAIGGINLQNIELLKGSEIAGVAVVSALYAQSDIEGAAGKLRKKAEEL